MKGLTAGRRDLEALIAALAKGRPTEAEVTLRYLIELSDMALFRRDE